jgi:hypothetical protein
MVYLKPLLLLTSILFSILVHAQEDNPFEAIGKKGKVLTASNGKYVETFDYDSVQRIGSVLINIHSRKIVRFLVTKMTFRKFSDNSSASRWWSVDPLAAKYPQWCPYAFAADNPIRFNDPDGREFIDQKGKHVAVTFNKDGTLKFSKNANADLVKLANLMGKTEIGMKMLHTMNDSKTQISMKIDNEHVVYDKNGMIKGGVTEPTISQKTINGKPVGEKYISMAAITIYEAGIKKNADDNGGRLSINGTNVDTKTTPIEDIMGSFGVHEGTHATDRGSNSNVSPKAPPGSTEIKPYANQLLHIQQLQQSSNNTSNDNNQ